MSTLSGTKWNLSLGSVGSVTFTFNSDGTASAGGGNVWYWGETNDGSFEVQTINPVINGNASEIYFGKHNGGQGNGNFINGWNGAKAILSPFTMSKLS